MACLTSFAFMLVATSSTVIMQPLVECKTGVVTLLGLSAGPTPALKGAPLYGTPTVLPACSYSSDSTVSHPQLCNPLNVLNDSSNPCQSLPRSDRSKICLRTLNNYNHEKCRMWPTPLRPFMSCKAGLLYIVLLR